MISRHDKLILRKLYILFGNGFPYFRSTFRRLGIKYEFSEHWQMSDLRTLPVYLHVTYGDGVTYLETENIIYLTEEGIEWLMQD